MKLVSAASNIEETRRLLTELAVYYRQELKVPRWSRMVSETIRAVSGGGMSGWLWVPESGEGSGVAALERVAGAGMRAVCVYLDQPCRSAEIVEDFVRRTDLAVRSEGGVFAWTDSIPGISLELQRSIFVPLGYVHFGRRLMRCDLAGSPRTISTPLPYGRRVSVRAAGLEKLLQLYVRCYEGHRDALIYASDPRHPDDSLREYLTWFFSEPAARPVSWGTVAVEREGELIAALLTNREPPEGGERSETLWVYEFMVAPEHRRKGIGKHLMSRFLSIARTRGETAVWLWVTEGNPAGDLYSLLGFQDVLQPEGARKGTWLKAQTAANLGFAL
jgi:GNAT superfamily N-acetyltransferase